MTDFAVVRVQSADGTSDEKTPIASLCHIFIVSECKHQLVTCLCVLCGSKTSLLWSFAESEIGKGGGDNMECWTARSREEREDFEDFYERSWPYLLLVIFRNSEIAEEHTAVYEKQWDSILDLALLPYEVNIQIAEAIDIDRSVKLGNLVQACFCLSPIELAPGFCEPLHIRERHTKIPF